MTLPQDMFNKAQAVLPHSYSPYSSFPVAACFRSEEGLLFAGCNVENASYGLTLCAESGALSQLVSSGQKSITEALILIPGDLFCPPCGACRQRLFEFAAPVVTVHMCTLSGGYKAVTVGELLPHPFGSENLEHNQ